MVDNFPLLNEKLEIDKDRIDDAEIIDDNGALVEYEEKSTEVVIHQDQPEKDIHAEEDYNKAREIYHSVSELGQKALEDIKYIASTTGEPRAFEVLATVMKSLNETAKGLTDLHGGKPAQKKVGEEKGITNIDKAVFVGSQNDLLNLVNKKNDNENTGT